MAEAKARAWWAAGLLALAAALYSSWLLGPWLDPAVDPVEGFASELAARTQRYSWLFRLGDMLTGIAAVAAALFLAKAGRTWRWIWVGILVFGAFTFLDATITPMDCATSVQRWCAAGEEAGTLSWRHGGHVVTSSIAAAGLVAAAVLAAWVWRDTVSVALAVLVVGSSIWTSIDALWPTGILGAVQRGQLALMGLWLLWAAWRARLTPVETPSAATTPERQR
ncbi:DUF998 domain-containing protein [Salininema proteolyticum]|uniref:DUF998 domain-containing protein n=1 Tax=Salininema proteolyticum TaxID=1607685 RepID=A0ABV8U133_9ACTN